MELNEKEVKLVCLFHNGKEAIVDLLAHFQSKETITLEVKEQIQKLKTNILIIYPKYLEQYPSELEKIKKELQICITLISGDNIELFNSVEHVLTLGRFVVNTSGDKRNLGHMDVFDSADYPDINSFTDFWKMNCKYIENIQLFLYENDVFDERAYFQRCLEIEDIIFKETKNQLYEKYGQLIINQHFDLNNLEVTPDSYSRLCCRFDFVIQFDVDEIERKSTSTYQHWFGGSKRRISFNDIDLFSDMSKKLISCIKNIFCDRLGEINKNRYSIHIRSVNIHEVKIKGKRENTDRAYYDVRTKPQHGHYMPPCYRDYDGEQGSSYWDQFQKHMKGAIKDLMGIDVRIGLIGWRFGDVIKQSCYFSKNAKWKIDEMYKLDEAVKTAKANFNSEHPDLMIYSIYPFFRLPTKKLNYGFQVSCYSYGLMSFIEDFVPVVQATLLEIEDF